MTVLENYAVVRQTSPDATTTPFVVTLPYSVDDADDVSISLLRSDNGEIAAPSAVSLASSSSLNVTNATGSIVVAIVIRVSDLSQDFNASNQVAIDTRSLVVSQDKQTKAIQELKGRDDLITSVEAFTVASKFVRKLKYPHFDDAGDLEYLDGFAWDDITGKPTEFPPEDHEHPWSEITDKPDLSLVGHTHVEADITDLQDYSLVGHEHVVADITDFPATLPPSAHDHAGENLGNTTGDPANRVQTLFGRYIDLPADGVINLGQARLMPDVGGAHYKLQIYDTTAETWIDSLTVAYDPDAVEPQATLTHFTDGNWHVGYRVLFGDAGGINNPFIRANDTIAGPPYENDVLQIWMDGSETFQFGVDNFLCYDPTGTLGSASAPWAATYTDKVVLDDCEIRNYPENIVFWFPNPVTLEDVIYFNAGGMTPKVGQAFNIGSVAAPIATLFATNVSTGTLTVSSSSNVFDQFDDEGAEVFRRTGNLNGVDGYLILEWKDHNAVNTAASLLKLDEDAGLASSDLAWTVESLSASQVRTTGVSTVPTPITSRNVRQSTSVTTTAAQSSSSTNGGFADFWLLEGLRVGDSVSAIELCMEAHINNGITVQLRYINLTNNADTLVEEIPTDFDGTGAVALTRQTLSTPHSVTSDRLYFIRMTFNINTASTDYVYGAQLEFDSREL